MGNIVEVVAALIWNGEKFMICQRPANKKRGLLWEFVGGKVEKGESKEQALIRECKEELDIEIEVDSEFISVKHTYPDITINLTVFNSRIVSGKPTLLEHNDLKWITKNEIPNYNFCPADKVILEKIKEYF
ncbi:(deoxy)nucleoside triphosphate pyrophosphohydrolase [Ruminococcus sp.]|uniref:(deoxy)nucleoside triphosphate pyrophosphohydrolase n=1 Tax=Ruminococcus sp. TaxID=41978 RepID=UPI002E81E493|nr:(deoxy)nucleoside triphosphate pyrophosphohydrolase [Ruminococcus sp.]MEE3440033.1 (deoxy)nucleoside triphosphate pyrophosphohydrolase [Ruminococcus sp.]